MLSLSMGGELALYRALHLLRLSRISDYLHTLSEALAIDPLAPLLATLLQPLYSSSCERLVVVSPWIEDVAFMLSPALSTLLGLPRILTLSMILAEARSRGVQVVVVTRSSRHDSVPYQSVERASLYTLAGIEPIIDNTVHSKCVETPTHAYISTANLTELELAKARKGKNISAIEPSQRCYPIEKP